MERARASWSSLLIFLLITGVLLYTKMLKETKKTIGFLVIIFIWLVAFQLRWRVPSLATPMVLSKLMQFKRITNGGRSLCDFVIFRKRNSLLSHFDHILHVFEAI